MDQFEKVVVLVKSYKNVSWPSGFLEEFQKIESEHLASNNKETNNQLGNPVQFSNEIILKIFTYLPIRDIIYQVNLVSKQFNIVSKDPSLIKEIHFVPNVIVFVGHIDSYSKPITEAFDSIKSISELIGRTKHLKINGKGDEMYPEEYRKKFRFDIVDAMQYCPKLTHLEVANLSNKNDYKEELENMHKLLMKEVFKLKYLKSMKVGTDFPFYSEDLITLSIECESLESFDTLDEYFAGYYYDDKNLITFMKNKKSTLKSLKIYKSSQQYKWLHMLPECTKLEELGIGAAYDLEKLNLTLISMLHNLKSLYIGFADSLNEQDFINLFTDKKLKNLTELVLVECPVTDKVLKTIALNCPDLKTLRLESTAINQEITYGMDFVLEHSKNMKNLSICMNFKDAHFLTNINNCLPRLSYLRVFQSKNIEKRHLEEVIKKNKKDLIVRFQPWCYHSDATIPFDAFDYNCHSHDYKMRWNKNEERVEEIIDHSICRECYLFDDEKDLIKTIASQKSQENSCFWNQDNIQLQNQKELFTPQIVIKFT